jgi:hypothetical protein
MSHQHSFYDCTSADFEKAALDRFRARASCLPTSCKIFREPWQASTVLCFDFAQCPSLLETTRQQAQRLAGTAQELGLAHAMIFRIGNKFMGWKAI